MQEKRSRVKCLQDERQAARPLHQQLRDIQTKLDKKEKTLQRRKDSELPDLRMRLEEAQANLSKGETEVKKLKDEIAELRARKEQALASQAVDAQEPPTDRGKGWKRAEEVLQGLRVLCAEGQLQEQFQKLQQEFDSLKPLPSSAAQPATAPAPEDVMDLDADEESALDKLVATVIGTKADEKSSEDGVAANEVGSDTKKRLKEQLKSHTAGLVRKRLNSKHDAA